MRNDSLGILPCDCKTGDRPLSWKSVGDIKGTLVSLINKEPKRDSQKNPAR